MTSKDKLNISNLYTRIIREGFGGYELDKDNLSGDNSWKQKLRDILEQFYRNVAISESGRHLFNMYIRPESVKNQLDVIYDGAAQQDVNLQNYPPFGEVASLVNLIIKRDLSGVESLYDNLKKRAYLKDEKSFNYGKGDLYEKSLDQLGSEAAGQEYQRQRALKK